MAKKKAVKLEVKSRNDLQKKYGSNLASTILIPEEERIWLPSRVLAVNYALGGGIMYGKIVELYGEESSGKTLLADDFGVSAQSLGGVILRNDAEQAFDPIWAQKCGIKLDKLEVFSETATERVSDWLMDTAIYWRSKLVNNEPILFIQDSIAALDTALNMNSIQTDKKAEFGNRAKAISDMLRLRNPLLTQLGVCSIFINQIRPKIGATQWEDPDQTVGGAAMKFYASLRVGIYSGKQIKDKVNGIEDRVGKFNSIRVKKNKLAPPRPTFPGQIFFHPEYEKGPGFDPYYDIINVLERTQVITRRAGTYRDSSGETICRGEDNFQRAFETDSSLRKKLLAECPINTISKTRKLLNSIQENRYELDFD